MGKRKSWVVTATKEKLPLTLGDGEEWIEAKDMLTTGEARDLADRSMGDAVPDIDSNNELQMKIERHLAAFPIYRVVAWATDWSLLDPEGETLPLTLKNIRSLHPDAFAAIDTALDAHITKMEEAHASPNPTTPQPANGQSDDTPELKEDETQREPTSTPS